MSINWQTKKQSVASPYNELRLEIEKNELINVTTQKQHAEVKEAKHEKSYIVQLKRHSEKGKTIGT